MDMDPLVQPLEADAAQWVRAFNQAEAALLHFVTSSTTNMDQAAAAFDRAYSAAGKLTGQIQRMQEVNEAAVRAERRRASAGLLGIAETLDQRAVAEAERRRQEDRDRRVATDVRQATVRAQNAAALLGVGTSVGEADPLAVGRRIRAITEREAIEQRRRTWEASRLLGVSPVPGEADPLAVGRRIREMELNRQSKERFDARNFRDQYRARRAERMAPGRRAARLAMARPSAVEQMRRRDAQMFRAFRRHPFRRTRDAAAAAGGFGLRSAVAGLGGLGNMAVGGLSSLFRTDSVVGLAATLSGVTLSLWGMEKAAQAAGNAVGFIVDNAMRMERQMVTFEVLTGSAEKGATLFKELQDYALRSPYTSKNLQEVAQQMLGMGYNVREILPTMERLGDVAAGDEDRLRRLGMILGYVESEGRVTGIRMRQLALLGIGPQQFAQTMGKSVPEVMAQMRETGLPADALTQTINRMTNPGGLFFGMVSRGMETVHGQWQNLVERFEVLAGRVGMAFFKRLNVASLVDQMGNLVGAGTDQLVKFAETAADYMKIAIKESFRVFGSLGDAGISMGREPMVQALFRGALPGQDDLGKISNLFLDVADAVGTVLTKLGQFVGYLIHEVPRAFQTLAGGFAEIVSYLPGGGTLTERGVSLHRDQFPGGKGLNPWGFPFGFEGRTTEEQRDAFRRGETVYMPGKQGTGLAGALSAFATRDLSGYDASTFGVRQLLGGGPKLWEEYMRRTRQNYAARAPGLGGIVGQMKDLGTNLGAAAGGLGDALEGVGVPNAGIVSLVGRLVAFQISPHLRPEIPVKAVMGAEAQKEMEEIRKRLREGTDPLTQFAHHARNVSEAFWGRPGLGEQVAVGVRVGGGFADVAHRALSQLPLGGIGSILGNVAGLAQVVNRVPMGLLGHLPGGMQEGIFSRYEELRKHVGGPEEHLPGAAMFGTAEAADTINRAQEGTRSVLQDIHQTVVAAVREHQEREKAKAEFWAAMQGLPPAIQQFLKEGRIPVVARGVDQ